MRKVHVFALCTLLTFPAFAHEYYLQPGSFSVALNEQFGVNHKNGMRFKGNTYPFINSWNVRSEAWQNGKKVELRGKDGDRPALTLKSNQPGLITIAHESKPETLIFKSWEKFKSYLDDEGLTNKLPEHEAKGFPQTDIKEVYTRFAKTLINVGGVQSNDQLTGLKLELFSMRNPASIPDGEPMPVQLLLDGKPLTGIKVKIFVGEDSDPISDITDENGIAIVPDKGDGPYLLNAVHMVEPQTTGGIYDGAHWETFWASLVLSR